VDRPFSSQVLATTLAEAGAWERVPAFLSEARAYAARAELLALPAHLDRLEGIRPLVARAHEVFERLRSLPELSRARSLLDRA
jgi:hypothetical protein